MVTMFLYLGVIIAGAFLSIFYTKILSTNSAMIYFVVGRKAYNSHIVRRVATVAIVSLPIVYVLAIRTDVGTDFHTYELMYHDFIKWDIGNLEPGIRGLFLLSKHLNIGFHGFLFWAATLSVAGGVMAIRMHLEDVRRLPIAFMIYLLLYFGPMCNIVSQMMALPFVIAALSFAEQKKKITFVIYCVIAVSFHKAAIIILPMYWLYYNYSKSRVKIIAFMIVTLSIFITFNPSILEMALSRMSLFSLYAKYIRLNHVHTFRYMLIYRIPIYLTEFIFLGVTERKKGKIKMANFCLIIELACIIMGIGTAWIGRIMYFFSFSHTIICPEIIYSQKKRVSRIMIGLLINLYFILAFGMMHFYSSFDGINNSI